MSMKYETQKIGAVAVKDGKYWGRQYTDGKIQYDDFGDIEKAKISDPEYCKLPTDMTWKPSKHRPNEDYHKLKDAKLVLITITTIYELND